MHVWRDLVVCYGASSIHVVHAYLGLYYHVANVLLHSVPDHVDKQFVNHPLIGGVHIDTPNGHHSVVINVVAHV